jgi:diguanylate cyclase (GGDEF)-like protein
MPEFPTVNFAGDDEGLFSNSEIQRLMKAECQRATRYRYAVTAMMIGVDRLEQLGDLYGVESKDTILAEVGALLRRSTRESDFLGRMVGSRFFAIFPHTSRRDGPALAARLLRDASQLLFDEGSARVNVTISVGLSFRDAGEVSDVDQLQAEVTAAVKEASAAGGSRVAEYAPPPAPPAPTPAGQDLDQLGEHLELLLTQKVAAMFESMGQSVPDFGGKGPEVLALAVEKMEAAHEQMRREHSERVSQLERRLAKMAQALDLTEAELQRAMSFKGEDSGVASIYRTVQGISDVEDNLDLKKEMMAAIFEANMELKQQSSGQTKGS